MHIHTHTYIFICIYMYAKVSEFEEEKKVGGRKRANVVELVWVCVKTKLMGKWKMGQ